ncbi:hypothetical protein O4H49_12450 [Kiloniella laminariae]|uniref:Yip1 domain-containing protein n=1 Tax=Kiloniella laminariae TaxID=454162 RepID=A0ABT4LKG8_9PROT|nr:hypothetical protein [Kiloniella laminariae]MCZ4281593.1 hypothetical protein [Kiloniella laminariae]
MIPSLTEMKHHLGATFGFLRLDLSGLEHIDTSSRSFWNSFFAAWLCLPGYIYLSTLYPTDNDVLYDSFAVLLIEALIYMISWLAYPVAIHAILVLHNKVENFRQLVIAINWLQLWVILVQVFLHTLLKSGLFPEIMVSLTGLLTLFYLLWVKANVIKQVIPCSWFIAVGLVFLDIVLSLSLSNLENVLLEG